ncbi:MAG: tetratricopeptide repeat protein [Phycisphaerales bacterium]|nr:tetratricopeptide repeat protein [Phycisphaerales bacterium]
MPDTEPRGRRDAVERLYIFWLASTLLLAVLMIASGILIRGQLTRQESALRSALERVQLAHTRAEMVEERLRNLERIVGQQLLMAPGRAPSEFATLPPTEETDPEDSVTGTPPLAPAEPEASAAPAETELRAQLARIAQPTRSTPADILDVEAANLLIRSTEPHLAYAEWSPEVCGQLAAVAQLIGRERAARAFAQRASAGGDLLVEYSAARIRALLARRQVQEAFTTTLQLVERADGLPIVDALLAVGLYVTDEPATADEVLVALVPRLPELPAYDRLLLGRVAAGLERWRVLDAALAGLDNIGGPLAPEHSFLTALALAHQGRTVEALAILDGLLEETPARGSVDPVWPWPRPDRYDIELWRGVTLTTARQFDTARAALEQIARNDPGRPEAHYQLGLLEARNGQPQLARMHLRNALAGAAEFAPAWEMLATLDIAEGQIAPALDSLQRALEINSRRARAYFLAAIAHAKVTQPNAAIDALREALRLAPEYLNEARQTDVLTRLIPPAEMETLLEGGAYLLEPAEDAPETAPAVPDAPPPGTE